MKINKNLALVPAYFAIGFCAGYSISSVIMLPFLLYVRTLTSSFDKYKYASLAVSKFKEVFLDKGLELYDWQIQIIGDFNLNNQHFTLMDLNLDSEQIEKAKEIVQSIDEKLKSDINKRVIFIAICAVVFLVALSFILELKSSRVQKDYTYKESPYNHYIKEVESYDIKGENILNALILKPFWPNCCIKFFEKNEVNLNENFQQA